MRTERSERWVRGWVGDVAVVDSRSPVLFWPDGFPVPGYAFDERDVRVDLLRPAAPADPPLPFFFGPKGPVDQWFDVAVDGRVVPHAVWRPAEPELEGTLVVSWDPTLLDRWTEEDEEVLSHPRDPYKRVDALPSSRHVQVRAGGMLLAESRDPVLLFETHLPIRFYLRREDVRLDLLEHSERRSHCPYKGITGDYWDLPAGEHGDRLDGVAWSYVAPYPAVAAIAGRVAFYDELVDVRLDGQDRRRPVTPFSEPANRPGSV